MPSLPTHAPFTVYDVSPGTEMSLFFTYSGVSSIGGGFGMDGPTKDVTITSGGGSTENDAIFIDTSVPESWTFQVNVLESELPLNFTDLVNSHVFLGTSSAAGNCAGLFISQVGLLYTGSVHINGGGNLVVDSPLQPLPDSQLLVEEGEYWTFRIATDFDRGTTYIYVTKSSQVAVSGHQLRYVLPAIKSESATLVPPDQTLISVRGTTTHTSQIYIDSIGVGPGLIIPNLQPRSDPGNDQAARTCSVFLLNGSASFDPDGGNLTYAWRLIDAPLGSQYIFDGLDGRTYPLLSPTGFTNLFHSASLSVLNAQTSIVSGTVLIVAGLPYNITGTGTDGHGFYVQIDGFDLPDSLPAGTAFKLLFQHGISKANEVKATFYPDVPGIFKFDLIVNDGSLSSLPAQTIVNVTESPVPRGCIPDMSFLWGYLSDFWRLLEDPERITVFWGALAQIASAELLNLWQIEYSKSLRDIQRTWQRKWLRYSLSMTEDPNHIEQTTVRALFGGVESSSIPTAGSNVSGTWIDLFLPLLGPNGTTYRIVFLGGALLTASQIANQLAGQLQAVNRLFSVTQVPNQAGTAIRVRINAPFAFVLASSSTSPIFTSGAANGTPAGTAGTLAGTNSYKLDRSLLGISIQNGDFLVLGGTAYRIAYVVTDPSDAFAFQRVTTVDPLPLGVGSVWSIAGQTTSKTLDFWNSLVTGGDEVLFEVQTINGGQLSYVPATALGACAGSTKTLGVDASPVGWYLSQPALYNVFLKSLLRRQYIPIDALVVDVPYLQELINNTDDTQILRRNVDYFLETFRGGPCLRFVVGTSDVWQGGTPPDHMWAEMTYLDNRPTIEANFGIPAGFTLANLSELPTNVDYLSAVQGLWYAYFSGPTLFNLRAGVQILLGLPFAEQNGVITEIRNDFSTTTGRILVQDTANAGVVRSYTYPASLAVDVNPATKLPYVIGDSVTQFAPLVTGAEVIDYVKQPNWFEGYLEQGSFVEVQKYFTFLVRTNSAAFDLNALLFVQTFIGRIKPTYTSPIFVVEEDISDTDIAVSDSLSFSGTLFLNDGPCTHGPPWNISGMWDDGRASGGGYWGKYDYNGITTPTPLTPSLPVPWGFDKESQCPDYFIAAILSAPAAGGVVPYDSIYSFDLPVYTTHFGEWGTHAVSGVPVTSPGISLDAVPVTSTGTVDSIYLEISGSNGLGNPFTLEVWQNGTMVESISFSKGPIGRDRQAFPVSFSVTMGDLVEIRIRATVADSESYWHDVLVILASGAYWAFDTGIPAGTYESYRSM